MPGKAITTERTNATAGRSLARHFRRRTTDDRQRYGAGGFRAPLAGRADEHGGLTRGVRCGQAERPRPRQRISCYQTHKPPRCSACPGSVFAGPAGICPACTGCGGGRLAARPIAGSVFRPTRSAAWRSPWNFTAGTGRPSH